MRFLVPALRGASVPLLMATIFSASAHAQFSFSNFNSIAGLSLNGSAAQSGSALRLTSATQNQSGSAWYGVKQQVAGGFDTTFTYNIGGGTGADGIAFVIQNVGLNALGDAGAGLGWEHVVNPAISPSLGVGFRTNVFNDIEVANLTSSTGGTPLGSVAALPRGNHTARITYSQAAQMLSIYLDNLSTPALIINNLNLGGLGGVTDASGFAFVGLTAGTGSAFDNQDITSWSFVSTAAPEPGSFALLFGPLAVLGGSVVVRRKTRPNS